MHRISLGQPDVPVDSSSLVEPSVAEAGIHSEENIVLLAIHEKIGEVEAEGGVSIIVSPNETAIHPNQSIPEHAVKLDPDPSAHISCRNLELAPVPAHAVLRIATAYRLVAVRPQLTVARATVVMLEWKLHRPVVRQVQRAPCGIVELGLGRLEVSGLGEIGLAQTKTDVFCRIRAMTKLELPAKIEE
jgi:hypothetical protein